MRQKYILEITPQTHVRATQNDRMYFRIPREKLRPAGLKRLLRLEKYNDYKLSLAGLVKQQKFDFPNFGASIKFFIPVPKTWSLKKKRQMHLRFHMSRPDIDNLCKSFFDSLFTEDKHIAHYECSKFWINQERGYIEITTGNFKEDALR